MAELPARLAALEAAGLRRRLTKVQGVDLTSNDVLGLSTHPAIRAALVEALELGTPHGAGASRLLRGNHPAWEAAEDRFARWQGTEAALAHATGFAANSGLLASLPEPGDVVISDALNHASLIDGLRLAKAEVVIVPHGDLDAAASALAARASRRAWVVLESVYSMDGDTPDLVAWAELCATHGARLVVDEAHATGLFGPTGQGRVVEEDLREGVFATIHTCGKALGLAGAFVCGSRDLVDWLVNRSRPFVFSTAPPPFLAAGLHAALDLVQATPALRVRPLALGAQLRTALPGVDTGGSTTHIVPVVVGSEARALALQELLAAAGWDARAIRPPTVPAGTSRLRLVLRAPLADAQVAAFAADLLAGLAALP
ncbi:MAG: 8-amino-7-oxononanoate synthase [Alphaproteobacteria bacterium]|nr:8-amino-7-oxononanoate synthase [Alphaproteobacteria bacterium]